MQSCRKGTCSHMHSNECLHLWKMNGGNEAEVIGSYNIFLNTFKDQCCKKDFISGQCMQSLFFSIEPVLHIQIIIWLASSLLEHPLPSKGGGLGFKVRPGHTDILALSEDWGNSD